MSTVVPRLNVTYFPGMPIKTKQGQNCYLIEYRAGHPCPLVLGLGDGIKIYTQENAVISDPDSEDLSAINNMFKKEKKQKKEIKDESKGISSAVAPVPSTASSSSSEVIKPAQQQQQQRREPQTRHQQNKPKDKERDCSIF